MEPINCQTYGDALPDADDIDVSLTVTAGGSYDFDVVKLYFGAQYFDEVTLKSLGDLTNDVLKTFELAPDYSTVKAEGYGLNLSADVPVFNGMALFGMGYVKAKVSGKMMDLSDADLNDGLKKPELTRCVVSAGYVYNLGKRTNVYGVASYRQDKLEIRGRAEDLSFKEKVKLKATTVMMGLRHNF